MNITRRKFIDYSLRGGGLGILSASLIGGGGLALTRDEAVSAEIGDDGLHKQDWFIESFLDLRDDQQDAVGLGKHFAIIWEQRGCPYCGEMHRVNLAKPKIADFIKKNFHVLQLDFRGSRTVTDFDGKEMSEQELARRWRVTGTPSINFFPKPAAKLAAKPGNDLEIWRLLGYWKPFHFIANFEYVHEQHYKTKQFHEYLDAKIARRKAGGKKVDVW